MGQDPAPPPWEEVGSGAPPRRARAGMVVDLRRCIGCHACTVACKTEHDVPLGGFRTRVRYHQDPERATLAFLPMLCMHCQDAPCMAACPTDALSRRPDGHVVLDDTRCAGNKACIAACPYGAIYIDPQSGRADKCDLCTHRTEVGMEPACVSACPAEVLRYGDLDDPEDPAARHAEQHRARPFKEEAGTRPSVVYIGLPDWLERAGAPGVQLSAGEDGFVYEQ